MLNELEKLEANIGGVSGMKRQPDAVFVIDLRTEQLAVREARRLGLPVIALVDTNCDPDEADFIIPGNDDAIRSCGLISRVLADAIAEGRQKVSAQAFVAPTAPAEVVEAPVAEAVETSASDVVEDAGAAAVEPPVVEAVETSAEPVEPAASDADAAGEEEASA